MSNWRADLLKQYEQQKQSIEQQVVSQEEAIADVANKARENLRGQLSDLEQQTEVAINQIRKAEAMEQRKQDLPLTRPKDIQAKERIADLNQQRNKVQTDITEAKEEIAKAETENLEAVKQAEISAMEKLDNAKRQAEKEAEKAEAEYKIALKEYEEFKANNIELATGEWIDKEEYNKLSLEAKNILNELGIESYNESLKKQTILPSNINPEDYVHLDTGEWVSRKQFDKLTPDEKLSLIEVGVDNFNTTIALMKINREIFALGQTKEVKPALTLDQINEINRATSLSIAIHNSLKTSTGNEAIDLKPVPLAGLAVLGTAAIAGLPEDLPLIIVAAALTAGAIYVGGNKELQAQVKAAIAEFTQQNGRTPTPADIVIVSADGQAFTLQDIPPWREGFNLEAEPLNYLPTPITKAPERLGGFNLLQPEVWREGFDFIKESPVIFLPRPLKETTDAKNYTLAYTNLTKSISAIRPILPQVATQDPRVADRFKEAMRQLQEAQKTLNKQKMDEATKVITSGLNSRKLTPTITENLRRALKDIELKRKLLEQAKRSFVKSLNPQPIKGHIDDKVLAAYASLMVKQLTRDKSQARNKGKTLIKNVVQLITDLRTQDMSDTAIQHLVSTYIHEQVASQTETQTRTKVQTQTQTKTLAQIRTLTKVLTKIPDLTLNKALDIPQIAEITTEFDWAFDITPPPIFPPVWIPTPEEGARLLTTEELKGAVGWKQGFIYKMIFPPYGQNNIVNSRKPIAGIKYYEGAESAYRSIIRIGGKLPRTIRRDMGIMDISIITPRTGKPELMFEPDVKQKTKLTSGRKQTRRKASEPSLMTVKT